MFGVGKPACPGSCRATVLSRADHRLPVRDDGGAHRALARRNGQRRAHQPGRHLRVLPGREDLTWGTVRHLRRGAARRAAPSARCRSWRSGQHGTERRVRRHRCPEQGYCDRCRPGLGEIVTTFAMVTSACASSSPTGHSGPSRRGSSRPSSPSWSGRRSAVSGTSYEPRPDRSAPRSCPGVWDGWWIYWVGPLLGTFLGDARVQPSRQADRGRQALPLRDRQRPARAEGWLRLGPRDPRCSATRPSGITSWQRAAGPIPGPHPSDRGPTDRSNVESSRGVRMGSRESSDEPRQARRLVVCSHRPEAPHSPHQRA